MSTYQEKDLDRSSRIEIMKDLTKSLNDGKAIGWVGYVKGIMPLFVRPKKCDPITGEVLTYRVIRDAKKGSNANPSQNMLTPAWKGKVDLIYFKHICTYCYIMYLYYGPGCHLAKADLNGAFRQFWLAPSEPQYCVYYLI